MLLKRLEISGFKSFARSVSLDFPTKITSIVGPNGSGKSNIADSIRWVLGEQSMKHLRGKKGEDLIFGGTPQVAKMGKASVSLTFDNKKKIFPVEFDEVIISRRVYRDGVNEYLLNGSQVRLKDTIELLSKVGLGASQHHIIAQGDADRILYASPKERKSMIEEALGLKIFELKKNEAERKLLNTGENIKQIESLRRELEPHLKYLGQQAEKSKSVAELKKTLDEVIKEYASREVKTLAHELAEIEKGKKPLDEKIQNIELDIKESEKLLGGDENPSAFFQELKKFDQMLEALSKKRREIEREIGRLEAEANKPAVHRQNGAIYPKDKIKGMLLELVSDLESVSRSGTMEAVRNTIFSTTQKIYRILEELNGGADEAKESSPQNNKAELKTAKAGILKLEEEEKEILKKKYEIGREYEARALKIQKEGSLLRQKSYELAKLKDDLRNFQSRSEHFNLIKKEFEIDFSEVIKATEPKGELLEEVERTTLRRKIERMRMRLEEAGGVDENVLTEFEETKKRDEFLSRELEDLKKASAQLKDIFRDLEEKIKKDFDGGISQINKLFGEFFYNIFSGGKAELRILRPQKKLPTADTEAEEWEGEEVEEEEGLDVIVDIPRKRIKSLAMLSGGERALVSIALLFAVSTVNPPPFLVLDETDAALDEANSQRYAGMLKELSDRTQLIVVTHNRETMKVADVLYGVTMGGDGVSKLLSIKFEEAEDVLSKRK
ncbi:AAA family ATPase [Candidatus Giovannonibacteria bacterium]|nr:AAA family ATPase [Candidatus Giovannonibacteria bacterium]